MFIILIYQIECAHVSKIIKSNLQNIHVQTTKNILIRFICIIIKNNNSSFDLRNETRLFISGKIPNNPSYYVHVHHSVLIVNR